MPTQPCVPLHRLYGRMRMIVHKCHPIVCTPCRYSLLLVYEDSAIRHKQSKDHRQIITGTPWHPRIHHQARV